jgi:hypothetical protein
LVFLPGNPAADAETRRVLDIHRRRRH